MKNYLAIVLLFIASSCFGQIGGMKSVTLNPFPGYYRNYVNVLTLGYNESAEAIYLSADSATKKASEMLIYPAKPKTFFFYLEGAHQIELRADIAHDSLKNYRYTVIADDTIVLAKELHPTAIKGNRMFSANLGTYEVANRKLVLTVYKVGDRDNGRETIIYNKKLGPVHIISAELVKEIEAKEKPLVEKKIENNQTTTTTTVVTAQSESVNMNIQGHLVSMDAKRSYAEIVIGPTENIFLYQILIKRQEGDNLETTLLDNQNWISDTYGNLTTRLDIKHFLKPGKYEIVIFPRIGKIDFNKMENGVKINFEMRKPALSTKEIGLYAGLVFLMLLVVFAVIIVTTKRKNRKKLLAEQQQKEMAKTQLATVRSQLNPHFLFNALAGIQNLMNQHKTDEANRYLAKFARLTRNVLDNKELISLADEKALIDDYLQMEQLRFGFAYQISIDPQLVIVDVEIPAMLLQPFVENAVKHGIAEMEEAGQISIEFTKQNEDLVLTVKDNGQGFDTTKNYEGLGLQLSKNRIALLNTIYKQTPFVLHMDARANETTMTITLTQWL
ncbi:histidine kinase [Pedobacter sp. KR3-3]|uniref:Histidine kinase n=1 Tax=Pedobacter albus TaxID=3113905 RepID=A0ABU7I7T1_9SPHI|nr:histidine kinase [Pedobacter sp. KR3-3]MEE1945356.1 histidine kinase [Pedobacter sp. KR3-3]